MKKILFISAVFASAFCFTSCDYNDEFKGLDETTRPNSPTSFELEYVGAPFSAESPASKTLPDWLYTKIFTADTGVVAMVKYPFKEPVANIIFGQDFERNIIADAKTEVDGWLNITTKGDNFWSDKYYSNNAYTQFSAYRAPGECEGWLVSPKCTVKKGMTFSFDVCVGNYNADGLKVLVSTNYAGNVAKAKWIDITSSFDIPQAPASGYGVLAPAGELSLDEYMGASVCFAFKYIGDGTKKATTTYQLDNIELRQVGSKVVTNTDEYVFRGYDKKWEFVRLVPKYAVNQDFESAGTGGSTELAGWLNIPLQGTYTWSNKSFSGNKYTQFSANKAPGECVCWLISPKLNINEEMSLLFDVNVGYYNEDCLQVFISSDFDGTKEGIEKANWTEVTSSFILPKLPTDTYGVFAPAGEMLLTEYLDQDIYVGFKYSGDGTSSKTTTYQLDNIFVGKK